MGIFAISGTAIAEVIPGIKLNSIPLAAKKSASSPPRPNTTESPPFKRTTTSWFWALL